MSLATSDEFQNSFDSCESSEDLSLEDPEDDQEFQLQSPARKGNLRQVEITRCNTAARDFNIVAGLVLDAMKLGEPAKVSTAERRTAVEEISNWVLTNVLEGSFKV